MTTLVCPYPSLEAAESKGLKGSGGLSLRSLRRIINVSAVVGRVAGDKLPLLRGGVQSDELLLSFIVSKLRGVFLLAQQKHGVSEVGMASWGVIVLIIPYK